MVTSIVVLVLLGLFGYVVEKTKGVNPVARLGEFVAFFSVVFLLVVPVLYVIPDVQNFDVEAYNSWVDDYFLRIGTFIENQTVGWVVGYIASFITGFITSTFK